MSNVSHIKVSSTVEITSGTISKSYIEDANGRREVPEDVGKYRYFVDVVEGDGTRIGMWDGDDYAAARAEAIECSRGFDGHIVDLTGRAA